MCFQELPLIEINMVWYIKTQSGMLYTQPKMNVKICQNGLGLASMSLTVLCVYIYTRKCYSIAATEGKFYIGSFVLRQFNEGQPNRLNECQQYKITYVCRTHLRSPNAVVFPSFQLFPNVPFDPQYDGYSCGHFFHCMFTEGPSGTRTYN